MEMIEVDGRKYRVVGPLDIGRMLAVWDDADDIGRVLTRDSPSQPWRLWTPPELTEGLTERQKKDIVFGLHTD